MRAFRAKLPTFLVCFSLVALGIAASFAQAGAAPKKLSFSVKEVRAYAEKASLNKTIIETAAKCDQKTDKYHCGYNHKPNCPPKIQIGPSGKAPEPAAPKEAPTSGGAGDGSGVVGDASSAPPEGSPIELNTNMSLANLSDLPGLKEASGVAAEQWVDLGTSPQAPEATTQSDGYDPNFAKWEERCNPQANAKTGNDYAHEMTRSFNTPQAYSYSECFRRECEAGAVSPGTAGASAEHGLSITHLVEAGGQVQGTLSSTVDGLSYAGGVLTIDSLQTYASFSSDGTAQGLKWSVSTTASGVKLAGQTITLPPGKLVQGPGFSFGLSAPYVGAPKSGASLTIYAPGLTINSTQQSASIAGAEVYASFGRVAPTTFGPPPLPPKKSSGGPAPTGGGGGSFGGGGGGGSTSLGKGFGGTVGGGSGGTTPVASGPGGQLLVYQQPIGQGVVAAIILFGLLIVMLLLSRWLQRFGWGKRLSRRAPLNGLDWIYRAFVKT